MPRLARATYGNAPGRGSTRKAVLREMQMAMVELGRAYQELLAEGMAEPLARIGLVRRTLEGVERKLGGGE